MAPKFGYLFFFFFYSGSEIMNDLGSIIHTTSLQEIHFELVIRAPLHFTLEGCCVVFQFYVFPLQVIIEALQRFDDTNLLPRFTNLMQGLSELFLLDKELTERISSTTNVETPVETTSVEETSAVE